MRDGTSTEAFTYAGDGQRRKKSTSSGDINYLLDEDNILEELDGSNNLIAHYTDFPGYWGGLSSLALPASSPAPQIAGMGTFNAVQFNAATFNESSEEVETQSHFYLFDLQSGNRLLLNADTTTDNEYLYKAFGEKVLSTGSIRNPFQFQGEVGPYFDANDRTWMRARTYNPITGRWDSPDPIGFTGRDWNLYRFVRNNPINGIDPSGYSPICITACVLAGGFIALSYVGCKCGGTKNPCETGACMLETFISLDATRRSAIGAGMLGCVACLAPSVGEILVKAWKNPILRDCLVSAVGQEIPNVYDDCRQRQQSDIKNQICNALAGCVSGLTRKGVSVQVILNAMAYIGCKEAALALKKKLH